MFAASTVDVGESFTLVNDHDPHPLRMQFERKRPGEMGLEYIERGPKSFASGDAYRRARRSDAGS